MRGLGVEHHAHGADALTLREVEGLSYEEAAGVMKCAVGTAKSRVFRARRQLQAWLAGEERPAAALAKPGATQDRSLGSHHIGA